MGRKKKEPISKAESEFREEISQKFPKAIEVNHRGSIAKAASALGISRQALYNYINKTQTPSASVIQRACRLWKKTLTDQGELVNVKPSQK